MSASNLPPGYCDETHSWRGFAAGNAGTPPFPSPRSNTTNDPQAHHTRESMPAAWRAARRAEIQAAVDAPSVFLAWPKVRTYLIELLAQLKQADTAEARIQEALLMLDDATAAANSTGICEADLLNVIDFAIQKLRPVPAPVHDAAALAKLTDEQLGEVASTVEPGSDAHYEAIMECCNRGLTAKAAHPDGCPKAQGLATCATCWCGEEKPVSTFKHAGPPRFELAQQEALDLFLRSHYAAGKDPERIYVRDIMRVSPGTEEPFAVNPKVQVQVTVEGYTDWYEVKLNDAGQPDPKLLLKLPF